jgi:hypothetical protein
MTDLPGSYRLLLEELEVSLERKRIYRKQLDMEKK